MTREWALAFFIVLVLKQCDPTSIDPFFHFSISWLDVNGIFCYIIPFRTSRLLLQIRLKRFFYPAYQTSIWGSIMKMV